MFRSNYVDMLGNYAFFGAHGPLAVGPPAKRQSFANQAVVKYLATKWPERGADLEGTWGNPECPQRQPPTASLGTWLKIVRPRKLRIRQGHFSLNTVHLTVFPWIDSNIPKRHQPLTRRRWKHAAGVSILPFIVQPVRVIWRSSSSYFNRCERTGEISREDPWGYGTQIGRYGVVATRVSKYLYHLVSTYNNSGFHMFSLHITTLPYDLSYIKAMFQFAWVSLHRVFERLDPNWTSRPHIPSTSFLAFFAGL